MKVLSKILSFGAEFFAIIVRRFIGLYYKGIYNGYRRKYDIDENFRFNGNGINFYGNGIISAGRESYIGEYSSVATFENCQVKIGKYCRISHFISIYTVNTKADIDYSNSKDLCTGDVVIGDYCWIGVKVTILGPVKIGENSCVGSNSVVNRDLPPHSIAIGVPAQVVKFKSYLSEQEKSVLAKEYENVLSSQLKSKYLE